MNTNNAINSPLPTSLALGGTAAGLTASNGGIFYSTASTGAILSGTATANQIILSGSNTTPAWSTATYPASTTVNQLLYSSSANVIGGLATANNGVLLTSASGVPSIGTATVVVGGTGDTSFTSYMPICGGISTTGALQSVSTSGASAGYVLTYVSSSALPTWQSNSSGGLPAITTNYQVLSSGTGTAAWYSSLIDTGNPTYNLFLGLQAGAAITSGSNNSIFGPNAGSTQTSYTNCTFIGRNADASVGSLTNATAIGYNASVTTSNSMVLGNGAKVGIGTSSPANILHIVGTFQQKGATSGYTGTDVIRGQTALQTTFFTNDTLATFPVGTTNNPALFVTANIVAVTTDGLYAAFAGPFTAAVWYDGTNIVPIGTLPTITVTSTDFGNFTTFATWVISFTTLELHVQGSSIQGSTVNWICTYEYFRVTTSNS